MIEAFGKLGRENEECKALGRDGEGKARRGREGVRASIFLLSSSQFGNFFCRCCSLRGPRSPVRKSFFLWRKRARRRPHDGVLRAWYDCVHAVSVSRPVMGDAEKPELTKQFNEGYKTDLAEPGEAGSLSFLQATAHDSPAASSSAIASASAALLAASAAITFAPRIRRTYSAVSSLLPACTSEDLWRFSAPVTQPCANCSIELLVTSYKHYKLGSQRAGWKDGASG